MGGNSRFYNPFRSTLPSRTKGLPCGIHLLLINDKFVIQVCPQKLILCSPYYTSPFGLNNLSFNCHCTMLIYDNLYFTSCDFNYNFSKHLCKIISYIVEIINVSSNTNREILQIVKFFLFVQHLLY